MGPPPYMWSVLERNVVMRRMTVIKICLCFEETYCLHPQGIWRLVTVSCALKTQQVRKKC